MLAPFLPAAAAAIRDPEAVALLRQIQRQAVRVPLESGMTSIATAYVHQGRDSAIDQSIAPLLLLHGFDSSLLEFRRLLPLLSVHPTIWAIDLFGSGFTEYPTYPTAIPITPDAIRQHLHSLLAAWIKQPVTLVGASLGGAVAIDLALHHPEWVQSLVLIDSVGFSGNFPIGEFLPPLVLDWGADWLRFRKQAALAAVSALPLLADPTWADALRCGLLHQDMPGWKAAIASFTQSGGYADLQHRITQIKQPTLILWGAQDDVLNAGDAVRFQQAIAGSQLIRIPGAGHVPHFEHPQIVARHLLNFVL